MPAESAEGFSGDAHYGKTLRGVLRYRREDVAVKDRQGNESKIEKFLMLMGKFGISELSRTGRVALARKSE